MTAQLVRTLPLNQLAALYRKHTAKELAALYGSTADAWYEYMRRRGIRKYGLNLP